MRRMIADLFKVIYKLTNSKLISLPFAVLYISFLYLVTIYGLCFLLTDEVPILGIIARLFRPPYGYGVFLLIAGFNFWLMLPLQNLTKDKNKPYSILTVAIYSIACFCLLIYIRYADRLFV